MLATLLAVVAFAGDVDPLVLDALDAELARRDGLILADAPPIYHLRYQLVSLDQVDVAASWGGLLRYSTTPLDALGVQVRIGSPELDNTGFGGWQNGFLQGGLPARLTPESARLGAWRLTDRAYKEAVEQYARKTAQYTAPDDHPGDYEMTTAVVAEEPIPPSADGDALRDLALDLSESMRAPGTPLERADVYVGHEAGAMWTLDTEGTRVRRPIHETSLRALVQLRAEDGMLLTDQRLWSVRDPSALPDREALRREGIAMRDGLLALADAAPLEEEYVGPVLFESDAAVDLFRYLLVPQVEGTPAEVPFDSWFGDLGASKDPVRLGRRVLPPGWQVFDDPRLIPEHPASFAHDLEGVPSERVELVTDGIVRDVLMSRVPRRGVDGTNGHARGWLGERAEGRVSQLVITPPRHRGAAALHRQAIKLARAYERDWYLVVRRLQEPVVRSLGQDFSVFAETEGVTLPPPVALVRVWGDGREEILRGAAFAGVERFALRDIVAAGTAREATWMAAVQSFGTGPTSGLPTWLRAADVLVGEVELVPAPGDPRDAPLLEPPP